MSMVSNSGGIRMLVVDDDPDAASSVKRLLSRKFKAFIDIAGDVTEARAKLLDGLFDIVILDYQLPDGNGIDLLREIAGVKSHPPVIMVTGHGDESTASEAFRLRAAGYVVKDGRLPAMLPEAVSGALAEVALKKAEDRLRRSEETERALLNATPESLLLLDAGGAILVANGTAAARLGMSPEEAIGKSAYGVLPGELSSSLKIHVDSVFRTGEAERFEDAREGRHYYNVVYPVSCEEGVIERVAVFTQDITERKQVEESLEKARGELEERVEERTSQLRQANTELRAEIAVRKRIEESLNTLSSQVHGQARMLEQILSSSPDYFYLLDGRGKFIYANSTAAGVLGLRQSDMEGKYWWELGLPEDSMKPLDIQREAVISSGEQRAGRIRLPAPSGWKDFDYILSPISGWNDTVNTVVATLRGISAEDLLMEELQRRLSRLEEEARLLDLLPSSVIFRDMNDMITFWNAGAERLYGWSSGEAEGRFSQELLKTEFPRPPGDIGYELMDVGSWEGVLLKVARDGSRVEVRSRWTLKLDAKGQPAAVLEVDDATGEQPPPR